MTAKRLAVTNAAFTLMAWVLGMVMATLTAYMYANIRGDLLPDGTIANGGPPSHWIGINFRAYLPPCLLVGSVLGVAVGQVQFLTWVKRFGSPNQ
jgi:hypothetical protein